MNKFPENVENGYFEDWKMTFQKLSKKLFEKMLKNEHFENWKISVQKPFKRNFFSKPSIDYFLKPDLEKDLIEKIWLKKLPKMLKMYLSKIFSKHFQKA